MESLTYYKNQRITPRKYREVVKLVKGMQPVQAMNTLKITNKKAARALAQVLKSAITNATTTLKVSDDMLQFKLFTIEEGNRLKRYRAASRGMARAFNRRMSHIKVILRTADVQPVSEPLKSVEKKDLKIEKKAEKKTIAKPASKKPGEKKAKVEKITKE